MALSLTCVCGARFELDDTLAGQNVTCPECQQTLKAPAVRGTPPRTSGLALASVVLALLGAFTGIGSAAAAVLGAMALVRIHRQRNRLAGVGLALFGIIAGIAFTVLFIFALFNPDPFGIASVMRKRLLAGQVDTSGKLEFVDAGKGFSITRPSKEWGIIPAKDLDDLVLRPLLHRDCDVLFVQTSRYAFVDVRSHVVNNVRSVEQAEQNILEEFKPEPIDFRLPRAPREHGDELVRPTDYVKKDSRTLDLPNGMEGRESEVEVICGGQRWHFLIRLYLTRGRLYVVRAFALGSRRFKAVRPEFDEMLKSFEILDKRRERPAGRE
jgi:hypothetical protein